MCVLKLGVNSVKIKDTSFQSILSPKQEVTVVYRYTYKLIDTLNPKARSTLIK